MQRKKKVETYDEDDWLQPEALDQDRHQTSLLAASHHQQPQAPIPIGSAGGHRGGHHSLDAAAPPDLSSVPPVSLHSMLAHSENSTPTWSQAAPATTSTFRSGDTASPLGVPQNLPPIKPMRRTPSAGILSALAVAESMASVSGSNGNLIGSQASSVKLTEVAEESIPTAAAPGTLVPQQLAPVSPDDNNFSNSHGTFVYTAQEAVQEEPCVSTFSVSERPLFSGEGGESEFDAIPDTDDLADSFGFLESEQHSTGESGATSIMGAAPQTWKPEASVLHHNLSSTADHQITSDASPKALFPDVYAYTAPLESASGGQSPTPLSVKSPAGPPLPELHQHETTHKYQVPGNELNFQGEAQDTTGPYLDELGLDVVQDDVDQGQLAREFAEHCDVAAEPTTADQSAVNSINEVQTSLTNVQAAQSPTKTTTWWGDDGVCYYDSPDGWRYFWDTSGQQWQPQTYIGGPSTAALSPDQPATDTIQQEGSAMTVQSGVEPSNLKETEAAALVEDIGNQNPAPEPELSLALMPESVGTLDIDAQYADRNVIPHGWSSTLQDQHTFAPYGAVAVAETAPPTATAYLATNSMLPQAANTYSSNLVPSNNWSPQPQHQHYSQPAFPPQHTDDRQLHGCGPFGKLIFGGRILLVNPSGSITVRCLTKIPAEILTPVAGGGGQTTSLKSRHSMLESFPGPLGVNINKEKLGTFVAKRQEACISEETGDISDCTTLWGSLITQCNSVSVSGTKGDANAALLGALTPSAGQQSTPDTPSPLLVQAPHYAVNGQHNDAGLHAAAAAAAAVQGELLKGNAPSALESAVAAQLWPLAFLIAKSLGAEEWKATVNAYADQNIAVGSPLGTLCRIVAGSRAAVLPDIAGHPEAAAAVGQSWRHHAAILLCQRTPESVHVLESLGQLLISSNKIYAAHCCFALAGVPLQYSDASLQQQFALVGTSRAMAPRTYASPLAIMRTELYTWSHTIGNPQAVHQFISVLPYKLIHAQLLAELGLLSQAAAYCASINTTMQALVPKVPPGLLVCKAACLDLLDRIQHHAAIYKVPLGGTISAGSIVSSVGKLLDRGISALMGGDDRHSSLHSRSSSFTDTHSHSQGPAHARRPSNSSVMTTGHVSPRNGGPETVHHSSGPAAGDLVQPKILSNFMGRVTSLKNLVAPPSQKHDEPVGTEPENLFYYDEELKIWRERGKELAPPPQEVGPPPIAPAWQTPPTSVAAAHTSTASPLQHGGVGRYANLMGAGPGGAQGSSGGGSILPPVATVPFGVPAAPYAGQQPRGHGHAPVSYFGAPAPAIAAATTQPPQMLENAPPTTHACKTGMQIAVSGPNAPSPFNLGVAQDQASWMPLPQQEAFDGMSEVEL